MPGIAGNARFLPSEVRTIRGRGLGTMDERLRSENAARSAPNGGRGEYRARRGSDGVAAMAALVLVLPLSGCGAGGDKAGAEAAPAAVVLTMLNPLGANDSSAFVEAVEAASNGSMTIEVTTNWHNDDALKEGDLIGAVEDGEAQLGITPVRAWHDAGVRSFDALIAPLLVDTQELQTAVLKSDVAGEMLAGVSAAGVTGIGIVPGPMRTPAGITRDLLDVSDYNGASIVISPSAVAARSFQALNATVTASVFEHAPIDTFDGLEQHIEALDGNLYDDTVRSITTNVNLWPRPLVVFGNTAALAALTDNQRQILQQAAITAVDTKTVADEAGATYAVGNVCRRGKVDFKQATSAQLDALHARFEPVYQWLREDPLTADYLDRIQEMSATVVVDPAAADSWACPDESDVAASGEATEPAHHPEQIDGVYTLTTTYEQELAAGDPHPIEENYGNYIFVFDNGRFAFTQEQGESCTWAYGRIRVDGDKLIWDVEDGGGQAPNNAYNKNGERFAYSWSLYQEVMTLGFAPGELSPEPFLAAEWHRISETPDASALNQKCPPPAEAFPAG